MTYTKQEIKEAKNMLLTILRPGDTVYTILRHVSNSGMSRAIDVYQIIDNQPRCITHLVAQVLGYSQDKKHDYALKVGGCGMDMGFHIVYSLSCALYCPDKYDHDSAYSLKHKWI